MGISGNVTIFLYQSKVNIQLEKIISLDDINSAECMSYNSTWSYDDCLLDSAIQRLRIGQEGELLTMLLKPNVSAWTAKAGVQKTVLQDLYTILMSDELQESCRPDCHSLVVGVMPEFYDTSTGLAQPIKGITRLRNADDGRPLPALNINVNLTIPDWSILSEVRFLDIVSTAVITNSIPGQQINV
jgi:hypothetical protein